MVSKATYAAWEAEVIAAFFTAEKPRTALIPVDGAPAVLSKEKFVLAVVPAGAAEAVAAGEATGLAASQHVQLWHIGKQKADGVRLGLDDGVYKYPACDVGGLTNVKQKLGEAVAFAGTPVAWGAASGAADGVAAAIVAQWARLAQKTLAPTLVKDVAKFLESLRASTIGDVTLRFFAPPAEHRVVVTSADVKAATGGKYYTRVFGGGDVFASESDGAGLYCGVTAKFITPNLNEGNLSMEYVQYPARFSAADPLYAAAVAAVAAVVTYGLYAVWMKRV